MLLQYSAFKGRDPKKPCLLKKGVMTYDDILTRFTIHIKDQLIDCYSCFDKNKKKMQIWLVYQEKWWNTAWFLTISPVVPRVQTSPHVSCEAASSLIPLLQLIIVLFVIWKAHSASMPPLWLVHLLLSLPKKLNNTVFALPTHRCLTQSQAGRTCSRSRADVV